MATYVIAILAVLLVVVTSLYTRSWRQQTAKIQNLKNVLFISFTNLTAQAIDQLKAPAAERGFTVENRDTPAWTEAVIAIGDKDDYVITFTVTWCSAQAPNIRLDWGVREELRSQNFYLKDWRRAVARMEIELQNYPLLDAA